MFKIAKQMKKKKKDETEAKYIKDEKNLIKIKEEIERGIRNVTLKTCFD